MWNLVELLAIFNARNIDVLVTLDGNLVFQCRSERIPDKLRLNALKYKGAFADRAIQQGKILTGKPVVKP